MKKPTRFPFVLLLLALLLPLPNPLFAQNTKAFYIGHSLSDQIPDMVKSLSDDHPEAGFDWRYQWIPGAPLWWQWARKAMQDYDPIPPHYVGFYDTANGLPAGGFDVLVLTESVPRNLASISETYQFADSFYVFASQYNPGLRAFVYELWHCLDSGTPTGCDYDTDSSPWRQRLTDDLPMWESVVDTLNARFQPENPVCLIPVGQGLARLHDAIQAGTVPGINDIEDLFSDRIHLHDWGKYFVACIHFSAIHKRSPVGLTHQLQVWWGGNFNAPPPALALKFKELARETVLQYTRNCLDISNVTARGRTTLEPLRLMPCPATDFLRLDYPGEALPWSVFDLTGRLVSSGHGREVDVRSLPDGVYLVRAGEAVGRFVKG